MDSEIPWLGSGAEPADCPIWRTVERLSVDREWPGTAQTVTPGHLILLALAVLPEMPNLIHEAGVGSAHDLENLRMPICRVSA